MEKASERRWLFEVHTLTCHRMGQRYLFCMQVEPVGRLAIQFVALNRTTQTVFVRTVHTQLVGTARMGVKGYLGGEG